MGSPLGLWLLAAAATLLMPSLARATDVGAGTSGSAALADPTSSAKSDAVDLTEPDQTAAAEPSAEPSWRTTPRERRYGFMVGFQGGAALGGASGFPNDALKIDREQFRTTTDPAFGGTGSLWIGGAFIDWLSFGLGASMQNLAAGDDKINVASMMFHVEAFPAYSLGGEWRELGMQAEMGLAFGSVEAPDPDAPKLIDSGGASRIGFGFFYEGIRFWQISTGPAVGADFIWSPSAFLSNGWIGWRTALYTGP